MRPLNLEKQRRVRLLEGPTPIQRLDRVEEALGDLLGGVSLFAKRDDIGGVGGGGNKLRKLEFLMGEAIALGADTIITVGGVQSNHARLTAAACASLGLDCELVLGQQVPRDDPDYQESGNILLDGLFGARMHILSATEDTLVHAEARAAVLRGAGHKVYVIGSGGSSPVGCLGYAACAEEIVAQREGIPSFREIIVPNGSGGTQAGLVAGLLAMDIKQPILSYTVLADVTDARQRTIEKVRGTLGLLGRADAFEPEAIRVNGSELGGGYGIPTSAMRDALALMARVQGLLIDPVYGGKAFAGLLAAVRAGRYRDGDNVLFLMTGGTPGLFAYRPFFASCSD
jgi:L-cysteate sulfo-lyase